MTAFEFFYGNWPAEIFQMLSQIIIQFFGIKPMLFRNWHGASKKLTSILISQLILPADALVFSFGTANAKVEGDTIVLGAAVSLTGKYSTNGEHTKNGYNLAVDRINSMGGVKVGGKSYKFKIIYYDDESNSKRAASTYLSACRHKDAKNLYLPPHPLSMLAKKCLLPRNWL